MEEHDIVIDADGTIRFVYSDALAEAFAGEAQHTVRASHVEPHPNGDGWTADMRPSGGPVLFATGECSLGGTLVWSGHAGFPTRQQALDAERAWLRENRGL